MDQNNTSKINAHEQNEYIGLENTKKVSLTCT